MSEPRGLKPGVFQPTTLFVPLIAEISGRLRPLRPSITVAWLGAALILASRLVHSGDLMLVAVLVITAAAWMPWIPWDLSLVAGAATGLLAAVILGLIGWLLSVPLLSTPALIVVCCWGAVCLVLSHLEGGALPRTAALPRSGWTAVAFAPAIVVSVAAVVNATSVHVVSRWFGIIIDNANHASMISAIRISGVLDYSADKYPRGLHAWAALSDNAAAAPSDLAHQLMSAGALPWIFLSLFLATLATALLRLHPGPHPVLAGVGMVAVGVVLLAAPEFVNQFVLYSASPSLLALVLLALPVLLSSVLAPTNGPLLWSMPLIGAALVHLWTPLALAPALVGAVLLVRVVTIFRREPRRWIMTVFGLVPPTLVAASLALPMTTALQRSGGLGIAALSGQPEIPQPVLLTLAAAGVVWLVVLACRGAMTAIVWLTVLTALLAGWAVLLVATGQPTNLAQWYPMKGFWFVTALAVPPGVVGVATGYLKIQAGVRKAAGGLRRPAVALLAALSVMGVMLGYGVSIWSMILWPSITIPFAQVPETRKSDAHPDGLPPTTTAQKSQRTVEIALAYSSAYSPAVTVPIAVGYDPNVDKRSTRLTNAIIAVETRQAATSGDLLDICGQVKVASGDSDKAVIVTALPVDVLRSLMVDQGCPNVPIRRIDWPVDTSNLTYALAQVRKAEARS